jgi:hypothetical protein
MPLVADSTSPPAIEIVSPSRSDKFVFPSDGTPLEVPIKIRSGDPPSTKYRFVVQIAYDHQGCPHEPDRVFPPLVISVDLSSKDVLIPISEVLTGTMTVSVRSIDSGSVSNASVGGIEVDGKNPSSYDASRTFPNKLTARIGDFESSGKRQFNAPVGGHQNAHSGAETTRAALG